MAIDLPRRLRGASGLVLLVLSLALVPARAQDAVAGPRTGDAWVDAALADIEVYAKRYPAAFVDELARYQSAPRALVEEALSSGVAAGDAYFACAMAQALGRPCRELLDARRLDAGSGWGEIAKRIEPERAGTALQRVKRGILQSYTRWARPIEPDAALRREAREPPGR